MARLWQSRPEAFPCRAVAVVAVLLVLVSPLSAVDSPPQLQEVVPAIEGDMLVCRVMSRGLPGDRLLQSMRSGLVSAIDLHLALLDENGKTVEQQGVSLSLAFDMWEELYSVGAAGGGQTFTDRDQLQQFLANVPALPVAPLSRLRQGERFRIRVGMILHAIAPSERERVADVIAGRHDGEVTGDSQETTVSLGTLIRFIYRDDKRSDLDSETISSWFRREELTHAED